MKGRGEQHIFIERGPDEYLAGPKWATEKDWPGLGNVKTRIETVGQKISNFSAIRFNLYAYSNYFWTPLVEINNGSVVHVSNPYILT